MKKMVIKQQRQIMFNHKLMMIKKLNSTQKMTMRTN